MLKFLLHVINLCFYLVDMVIGKNLIGFYICNRNNGDKERKPMPLQSSNIQTNKQCKLFHSDHQYYYTFHPHLPNQRKRITKETTFTSSHIVLNFINKKNIFGINENQNFTLSNISLDQNLKLLSAEQHKQEDKVLFEIFPFLFFLLMLLQM
jgi:hypothetical protein